MDRTLTLAPVTRHVDETIGYKQLRRMLAPFAGHFDDWPRDSVELQFAIALAPLPQEADSIRNTRLYRKQDDGLLVRVPRRLVLTERR